MTNTPAREGLPELPELPEPVMRELNPYHGGSIDPYNGATHLQWYTADQMRAYALAAIASQPTQGGEVTKAPYGYCPICGAKGTARERRPNGDDICANNHKYPSRAALPHPQPDCWCLTCRPNTLADMRMALCPTCGNKRCPKANDHRNGCTDSNEPGQPGSAYPTTPPPPSDAAQGFEEWWQQHGQYSRAGGGEYEKTFAHNAWVAASQEGEKGKPFGYLFRPRDGSPWQFEDGDTIPDVVADHLDTMLVYAHPAADKVLDAVALDRALGAFFAGQLHMTAAEKDGLRIALVDALSDLPPKGRYCDQGHTLEWCARDLMEAVNAYHRTTSGNHSRWMDTAARRVAAALSPPANGENDGR